MPRMREKLSNEYWHDQIDRMNQIQMASMQRFAPPAHPIFSVQELYRHFNKRFKKLGGMTPALSKEIGWM